MKKNKDQLEVKKFNSGYFLEKFCYITGRLKENGLNKKETYDLMVVALESKYNDDKTDVFLKKEKNYQKLYDYVQSRMTTEEFEKVIEFVEEIRVQETLIGPAELGFDVIHMNIINQIKREHVWLKHQIFVDEFNDLYYRYGKIKL